MTGVIAPGRILQLCLLLLVSLVAPWPHAASGGAPAPAAQAQYGDNQAAGRFVGLNGIRLYYEVYGEGQPLLLIHGNGQSIRHMANQIDFFSGNYRVLVADSRGHGKSEFTPGQLTYEQMAEDINALLDHLGLNALYVLGWSDGGIIGLLLAADHPDKVGRLAVMGANLRPDGAYPWALEWVAQQQANAEDMISRGDNSMHWERLQQQLGLLANQPDIPARKLATIAAPVLVMAGDRDVIRDDHTLEIFHAIPNSYLAIFPGATHFVPEQDPQLFNETVSNFFTRPFKALDTRDFIIGGPQ